MTKPQPALTQVNAKPDVGEGRIFHTGNNFRFLRRLTADEAQDLLDADAAKARIASLYGRQFADGVYGDG